MLVKFKTTYHIHQWKYNMKLNRKQAFFANEPQHENIREIWKSIRFVSYPIEKPETAKAFAVFTVQSWQNIGA